MDCTYVFQNSTPSGFTCSTALSSSSSEFVLGIGHITSIIWNGFGILAFLLTVLVVLYILKNI